MSLSASSSTTTTKAITTKKILPSRRGNLCIIMLNNPKPLHALTMDMIDSITTVLKEWHNNNNRTTTTTTKKEDIQSSSSLFLLKACNDETKLPAFCAGGDVKSIYLDGIKRSTSSSGGGSSSGNIQQQQHGYGIPGLLTSDFFRREYQLNHRLATTAATTTTTSASYLSSSSRQQQQQQDQISIWDGIVMGGGVGISIYGKYRIATENTIFAMPETQIGLFPDVGSMYWMTHHHHHHSSSSSTTTTTNNNNKKKSSSTVGGVGLKHSMALYIALTGQRLYAADLLYTGLATHYIPSQNIQPFENALVEALKEQPQQQQEEEQQQHPSAIQLVLDEFHQQIPTTPQSEGGGFSSSSSSSSSYLEQHADIIERVFGNRIQETKTDPYALESIIALLSKEVEKKEGDDDDDMNESNKIFATTTLEMLNKMSPTSLKLTYEGLRRGYQMSSLKDDLIMEYRMCQHIMRNMDHDFYEGIRAMLIDKDHKPIWKPSKLEDVTSNMIQEYFTPIQYELWNDNDDDDDSTSKL